MRPKDGEGEDGVEEGGGQAGAQEAPRRGQEAEAGGGGEVGEDDESLQEEKCPGAEIAAVQPRHGQHTAQFGLWANTQIINKSLD